jgi:hypothetical protein
VPVGEGRVAIRQMLIFGNPRLAPSSGNNPNVLDHASGC